MLLKPSQGTEQRPQHVADAHGEACGTRSIPGELRRNEQLHVVVASLAEVPQRIRSSAPSPKRRVKCACFTKIDRTVPPGSFAALGVKQNDTISTDERLEVNRSKTGCLVHERFDLSCTSHHWVRYACGDNDKQQSRRFRKAMLVGQSNRFLGQVCHLTRPTRPRSRHLADSLGGREAIYEVPADIHG